MFGGKAAGIEVTNGGGGVIKENEVFDNYFDGICLATGVNPTLKGVCVVISVWRVCVSCVGGCIGVCAFRSDIGYVTEWLL